ncbi:50S ribosomal protein L11 methyltransferase [Rhodovibrio salinarum]|uniref:Ribosomal protein L11 methyltransferase n=1 Tax=Rhodovibrio salinarum TaxID=1087 RepID=A0A934QF40_9PROT|nr:50S ribosomal protein L11 methyltransferase [Rhodovibrio salinarum]MBK1695809.1 50S ribosomal protein L11 methyltransferase [Rhodovibrio salinarum]
MSSGHHLHLDVPQSALATFEAALQGFDAAIVTGEANAEGQIPVDVYLATAPDPDDLDTRLATAAMAAGVPQPAVESQPLPDVDWVQQAYEGLPPIHAGRFWVYGEHDRDKPRPAGSIAFHIEANQAFGTGRHETTLGCLLEIERLAKTGFPMRRALDMGAGSGLLAFAVARLWRRPVIAADNDPNSVRICAENAQINGVAPWVTSLMSDGYADLRLQANAPYDLICANILAEPLTQMARDLDKALAPGGIAILSGLLNHQARKVLLRHRAQGLVLLRRRRIGDWTTLVLRQPAGRVMSPPHGGPSLTQG